MNGIGYILTSVMSLGLLWAVIRSRLELNRTESSFVGCLAFVFFSMFLLASDGRIIPGGLFFSIHGEIIPIVSCLVMLWFIGRDFRAASVIRRIGLLFLAVFSVGIITLATVINVSFWFEPHARGDLVAW
jgi:hypothetical protein